MNDSAPPFIIRLAAALAIVLGAGAIVDIAVSLFIHDKLSLNLGFVGIAIGYGLLMGRESSRHWAIVLSGLVLILTLGVVAWIAFSGQLRALTHEQLWIGGIYVAITILICATVFFGLRSASARAWPWSDLGNVEQSHPWATPLVLIGVLFATLSALRDVTTEAKTETLLRSLFPVQTQFEFRDARTGERLESVGYSGNGVTTTSERRDPFAPRTSFSFSKGSDGRTAELTGFSGKPFDVTFTADGYQPVTYTLNDKSPRKVMLEFQAL